MTVFGRVYHQPTRSTQPCIPPGSLNRVTALIGWGKGGNVPSAGCVSPYGPRVPIAVRVVANCYTPLPLPLPAVLNKNGKKSKRVSGKGSLTPDLAPRGTIWHRSRCERILRLSDSLTERANCVVDRSHSQRVDVARRLELSPYTTGGRRSDTFCTVVMIDCTGS